MTANPPPCGSEALGGADDIWGVDDEVTTREWSKMDEDFTNAGYREGITAGKEGALQEGFDDGFDSVGAPLGREIGVLRGAASAVMSVFSSSSAQSRVKSWPDDAERWREELRSITRELGRIHLADLAPRDMQAEEHAREHLEADTSGEIHVTVDQGSEYRLQPMDGAPPAGVAELQRLRARLARVLEELGLNIALD